MVAFLERGGFNPNNLPLCLQAVPAQALSEAPEGHKFFLNVLTTCFLLSLSSNFICAAPFFV